jgi:hypothetical protein
MQHLEGSGTPVLLDARFLKVNTNWLMFFKEADAICYDSRAKFITALCDGGEELLNMQR